MACAEGIVRSADSNMLAVNGGHILIMKDWAKKHAQANGIRQTQGQHQGLY